MEGEMEEEMAEAVAGETVEEAEESDCRTGWEVYLMEEFRHMHMDC